MTTIAWLIVGALAAASFWHYSLWPVAVVALSVVEMATFRERDRT